MARLRGRVGSLLEVGTGFHPELTGRENIYLNGSILGMKRAEITRKFDEIVAFSEVERFLDTPVKRYSSGMYIRLAFAVAAHLEPEILVVDEVLAVGDIEFQKKCLGKMNEVVGHGRTVFFVSHNMQSIAALTSRCLVMKQGELMLDAPTAEAVKSLRRDVPEGLDPGQAVRQARAGRPRLELHRRGPASSPPSRTASTSWGEPIAFEFVLHVGTPMAKLCFMFWIADTQGVQHHPLLAVRRGPALPDQGGATTGSAARSPSSGSTGDRTAVTAWISDTRGLLPIDEQSQICQFEVHMGEFRRKGFWPGTRTTRSTSRTPMAAGRRGLSRGPGGPAAPPAEIARPTAVDGEPTAMNLFAPVVLIAWFPSRPGRLQRHAAEEGGDLPLRRRLALPAQRRLHRCRAARLHQDDGHGRRRAALRARSSTRRGSSRSGPAGSTCRWWSGAWAPSSRRSPTAWGPTRGSRRSSSQIDRLGPALPDRPASTSTTSRPARLARAMVIGGLVYVPLCLFEIRFSPILQLEALRASVNWEAMRYGGYRPKVFLVTGLELGMWMANAACRLLALGHPARSRRSGGSRLGSTAGPVATAVLCKSTGAGLLLVLAMGALWIARRTKKLVPVWADPGPPAGLLRSSGRLDLWSGRRGRRPGHRDLRRGPGRVVRVPAQRWSGSLIDRAMERPILGWGGFDAVLGHSTAGRRMPIPDGYWIIVLGIQGAVGLVGACSA